MKEEKKLHRRGFIKNLAIMSGAVACGALTAVKAKANPVIPEKETPVPPKKATQLTPEMKVEAPELPWGYQELDPEYVRKLGHIGFYEKECGGGVFWAIMTALKEKIGYPYNFMPLPSRDDFFANLAGKETGKSLQVMMQYGVGGAANFGSLCGAPNGAASAITIALPYHDAEKVIPKLFRYYETTAFPNHEASEYVFEEEYYPPKYLNSKVLPQNVSHSVLCHVSVGKWCAKSGYASKSYERFERCARLAGDVAAMAVTLMNAHIKGDINTVFPTKLSKETASCKVCHFHGEKFEAGQFTRGSMECESCHTDMRPHLGENKLTTAYGIDVGKWAGAAAIGTGVGIGAHAVAGRLSKKGEHDEE
ncbi:MAG: hypothetical protein DRH03_02095 [Deltaproteobacteria bacterium]|nr:MAG: hypothetical protein DRH03_02095 [Deltaproteobacteria bacterium]